MDVILNLDCMLTPESAAFHLPSQMPKTFPCFAFSTSPDLSIFLCWRTLPFNKLTETIFMTTISEVTIWFLPDLIALFADAFWGLLYLLNTNLLAGLLCGELFHASPPLAIWSGPGNGRKATFFIFVFFLCCSLLNATFPVFSKMLKTPKNVTVLKRCAPSPCFVSAPYLRWETPFFRSLCFLFEILSFFSQNCIGDRELLSLRWCRRLSWSIPYKCFLRPFPTVSLNLPFTFSPPIYNAYYIWHWSVVEPKCPPTSILC